jgi:hypothetical protein
LRIHCSTIVTLARVQAWQPQAAGEAVVTLHDGILMAQKFPADFRLMAEFRPAVYQAIAESMHD